MQGRQLASMGSNSCIWTFDYDSNGMRTERSNGYLTYRYVYNGSQLSQMTYQDSNLQTYTLYFAYDASGRPMTVFFDSPTDTQDGLYYYVTNLQGDVVAILDGAGNAIVTYTYDAWGKPLFTHR